MSDPQSSPKPASPAPATVPPDAASSAKAPEVKLPAPPPPPPGKAWAIGAAVLLALLVAVVYLPVLMHPFVNWDDPKTVLENPLIRSLDPASLKRMFTTFYAGFWSPITHLSLALDRQWGGLAPGVYHRTNLLLHAANTVLFFLLGLRLLALSGMSDAPRLGRLTAPFLSAFVAAFLFGLHPLRVETVAWVTGRKDLLCALFFLACLLAYLDYVKSPSRIRYGLALFLGLMAMLSKPMAVTLPLVLVLLDVWPLKRSTWRFSPVTREKFPFLVLAIGVGFATLAAESRQGALPGLVHFPLDVRVMNAFHSLAFYLHKTVWPEDLSALVPLTGKGAYSLENQLSVLGALLAAWFCYKAHRKYPGAAAAFVYYIVTLLPVLGLVQVGGHAAADRYSYLPLAGPFLLLSAGAMVAARRRPRTVAALGTGVLLIMTGLTSVQIGTWKSSIDLWERVVKVHPKVSAVAYSNLGDAYREDKLWNQALDAYDQAIALEPDRANPYNGRASVQFAIGRIDQALDGFRKAVAVEPGNPQAHYNLGYVLAQKGRTQEALDATHEALRLDPAFAQAWNNLGSLYGMTGRHAEAASAIRKALALDPGNAQYRMNLDAALKGAGR